MKLETLLNWRDTEHPDHVTAWWSYKLHYAMKEAGFYSYKEWKRIEKELPFFIEAYEERIFLQELRENTKEASSCPSTLSNTLCMFLLKEYEKYVNNLLDLEGEVK